MWMTDKQSNELENMLHIKYDGKLYYREVPEILNSSWEYEIFNLKPLGFFLQKQTFLVHFAVPIYLQLKEICFNNYIHITTSLS